MYHTLGNDAEMRSYFEHKNEESAVGLNELTDKFITPDNLGKRAETNEEAIEGDVVQELLDNNFDIDKVAPKDEGVGTLGPELERINPVETHSSTVTSNTINKLFHKFQEISAPYYKSKESKVSASAGEMWSNLSKPILKNNTSKFIKGLNKEDLLIFESIAIKSLSRLGYNLLNPKRNLLTKFIDLDIERFIKINSELKENAIKNASKTDLILREPHENFKKKNLASKTF